MPESSRFNRALPRPWVVLISVLSCAIALLPWWRNHDYLRDLYDYGLVIAGLGLIEQGQHPYVDFLTPIQAGFFGMNRLAEKLGGGAYLGLTYGGAALILAMVTGLTGLLARRWPYWAAAIVALTVTAASASQHTILWHNSLGVGCLALVVWTSAVSPVWRRSDWVWHGLTALGLFVGGLNKMNFHLVALAAALAWSWRAGLLGRARWREVGLTGLVWLVAGLVLPIALELGWTGATWKLWMHNVVGLAVTSRADTLAEIFHAKFLFTPIHDYYGALMLPQAGLAGVLLTVAAGIGCAPGGHENGRVWLDKILLPLALVLVAMAGAALLATNQEIAYVGLAAWLVLIVGVWLGFAPPLPRRAMFLGGLVLPSLAFGAVAWSSAWAGQRSQFGYSEAARSTYTLAETAGPTFNYLHGVHLPPEMAVSFALLDKWLPQPGGDGRRAVFYGAGMEWVQRIQPGLRAKEQPLWVHWGTTYGPREVWNLIKRFDADLRQQVILTQLARDGWPPELGPTLRRYYRTDLLGPVIRRWSRITSRNEFYADAIAFADLAGGNVASRILRTEESPRMAALPFLTDRIMLGVMGGEGLLRVGEPSHGFGADAVIERAAGVDDRAMYADFRVIEHGSVPENIRWSGHVELPAGQGRVAVPFMIDAQGRTLQLRVQVPDEFSRRLSAGYRNFNLNPAIESAGGPPQLRELDKSDGAATPELLEALFGGLSWRPQHVVVRGASFANGRVLLPPGSEIWFHTDGMLGEIFGQLAPVDPAAALPTVRALWYKGGRLQITQQGQVPQGRPFDFHVWCAEPGGWIGLLIDPAGSDTGAAQLKVTSVRFEP